MCPRTKVRHGDWPPSCLSRSRPSASRVSVGIAAATAADWPVVVADSGDAAALAELAGRTRVVATTVGPYRQYGIGMVGACAAAGTHYADLNGEPLFMREAIELHYLWRVPVRLDNKKLVALLGEEPHTMLDDAVRESLHALGCLPDRAGRPTADQALTRS